MPEKALYVLSGDPITRGHIDVAKRAKKMFGSLRVALAVNPGKKYLFDLKERENLARQALQGLDITVDSFSGLTVDYAQMNCIDTIIRSARSAQDFDMEKMLYDVGVSQEHAVETVLLFARQELSHISSSAVKELQRFHGLIHTYVPLVVKQALEKKISNQVLLGWTGEIGAGKSYIAGLIKKYTDRFPVHEIDMDRLGHEILLTDDRPMFLKAREEVLALIHDSYPSSEPPTMDMKVLGSAIFGDSIVRDAFNEIMKEPMLALYREKLAGLEGLILVTSALFAEMNIGYLTNNNIVIIKADKELRKERLEGRSYDEEEIERRMSAQMDFDHKLAVLQIQIHQDGHGKIWVLDNSPASIVDIKTFFDVVTGDLGL